MDDPVLIQKNFLKARMCLFPKRKERKGRRWSRRVRVKSLELKSCYHSSELLLSVLNYWPSLLKIVNTP
ncbi:hypothetical protein LEMLEM_LOCUS6362, partial [Lemmus lemmus]